MRRAKLLAAALLALAASQAGAQTIGEPLPIGPLLAPPAQPVMTSPSYASHSVDFAQARLPPQAFRWGWFGAERFDSRPQWHYDYQRTSMRWKYHR